MTELTAPSVARDVFTKGTGYDRPAFSVWNAAGTGGRGRQACATPKEKAERMSIFREGLFAGKVALITGGGTGIGLGITEGLSALGADTAILSRKAEHLGPSASAVAERTGRKCLPLVADVRQPEQVEEAVRRVVEDLGRLDILVNAAAGNFFCPSADLTPNGFGTVIDIDAKGTWHACRAAYRAAMAGSGGSILNISATLHIGGTPGQLHVASAKAAVDALTRTLAVEWGPRGVRVNAIAPGPVGDTEGARRLFPGPAGEALRQAVPARRLGTIADIVNLALFLLSDAAANINGAIVVSDGGLSLAGSFGVSLPSPASG
jgi:peroxisomal 2,4-dienoyl-CoA reductase